MYADRARFGAFLSFLPRAALGAFSAFSAALRCNGIRSVNGREEVHIKRRVGKEAESRHEVG